MALPKPNDQFVIVDVGARFDFEPMWTPIASFSDFIGFEPDEEGCGWLNRSTAGSRKKFYPHAIGIRNELRSFYVTEFPDSSGLYEAKESFFLGRFPYSTLKTIKEIKLQTITLDKFIVDNEIQHVDFIKIDVEGAELDVLEGATHSLKASKVLGIKTELWWDPAMRGQRSFAETDVFLRSNGFRLYDIELTRYPMNTLPCGRLRGISVGPVVVVATKTATGQILTGDALYFRDPVGDKREDRSTIEWDNKSLLRLCGLLDLYGYGESAIEIAEEFRDRLAQSIDVDALIDSFVPRVGGRVVAYDVYREASVKLRIKENLRVYGKNTWSHQAIRYRNAEGRDKSASVIVIDLMSPIYALRSRLRRIAMLRRIVMKARDLICRIAMHGDARRP